MITQFNIADITVKIFGTKRYANGSPNIACLVILFSEVTGLEAARITTNKLGYFEFIFSIDGFVFGNYQVQFYGSDTRQKWTPLGDWEILSIPDPKAQPLAFEELPNIAVTESEIDEDRRIDINNNEFTTLKIELSNIKIASGDIAFLVVQFTKHLTFSTETEEEKEIIRKEKLILLRNYKLSVNSVSKSSVITNITYSAGVATVTSANHGFVNGADVIIANVIGMTDINGTWKITNVTTNAFDINMTTAQSYTSGGLVIDAYIIKCELPLYKKPSYYDFRFYFLGRDLLNGKLLSTDSEVKIDKTNIQFDGVADLLEYYEVQDLLVNNSADPESGVLDTPFAQLSWKDYRTIDQGFLPLDARNGYTGANTTAIITFEKSRKITAYGVWMYVSDELVMPINKFPNKNVGDSGEWYFVGDYVDINIEVRLPSFKFVAFWVGCKTYNTDNTSDIIKQKLTY